MNQTGQFQLGIDIGGTFTDFSLSGREFNHLCVHKQLSTPDDPLQAVCEGLGILLSKAGVQLSAISRITHATTLVANAVMERKGDATGMLCTKGFISALDIGREQRYDLYDMRIKYPEPLVPLPLRREIDERISSKGEIETDLPEQEVLQAVQELTDRHRITSVAVCFINSYRNPVHERRAGEIVTREFPGISVSTSADVLPAVREYERWTTAVVNAYSQSIFRTYLAELDAWLTGNGFTGTLHLLGSDGGVVNIDTACRYPVRMLASGSAAVALRCGQLDKASAGSDLLMLDMGGTTAKLGIISSGKAQKRYDTEVGLVYRDKSGSGLPVSTPVLDLAEIAAGGGSIAAIDERGVLKVGPESMGAKPGPACFGLGGEQPTPADANLLLGYYGTDTLPGGKLEASSGLAGQAIAGNLAGRLAATVPRTAWGIYETVNEKISAAIKNYSAARGIDYRKCRLVACGGAAPAHAMAVAGKLGMAEVIIPFASGVASAVGLLGAPVSFESMQSYRTALGELSPEGFINRFTELENSILRIISREHTTAGKPEIARRLDMRYQGQGFELEVRLPFGADMKSLCSLLPDLFHETYEKHFFTRFPDRDIEIINWKAEITVAGTAPVDGCTFTAHKNGAGASTGIRNVYSYKDNRYVEWPVFNRYALRQGEKITGPMLIEDDECTAVIHQGDTVEIDNRLNLIASPAVRRHEK